MIMLNEVNQTVKVEYHVLRDDIRDPKYKYQNKREVAGIREADALQVEKGFRKRDLEQGGQGLKLVSTHL